MSDLHLQPLPGQGPSLTEQVYSAVARMLLDSTLKPDSRTSIRELAEELGVSTMPVREAVGRLVAQGALAIRKNRAVEVPRMTPEDFRELTRTRLLLECEAARLAVARITDQEVEQIRAFHFRFRDEMEQGNRGPALMLNRQLHFALYDAAKAATMSQMIAMAWLRAGPLISLDIEPSAGGGRIAHSVTAHEQLVAALDLRDGEAAATAIRSDISGAAKTILEQRKYFRE
ncbi:GntR family transcriptional regulator [Xinfangfangia sp. D13-10-4-6]|uniref:GntR family transcriptional regulator n=1 Tax=Pseudogemmobacter hezensis TaxID=2737662 RepID=UPI0015564497|nr:GntR family transcriptional regulator [Pseudogemmobacter hezensis]NPD16814.1 GntR family transcriptional regulator [Pseudogemmobacter hezensis]